jgi:hypothetical protein
MEGCHFTRDQPTKSSRRIDTGRVAVTADRKYHATPRLVVAKDGRTMTATQKGTGAEGKAFTQMLAFDKQ